MLLWANLQNLNFIMKILKECLFYKETKHLETNIYHLNYTLLQLKKVAEKSSVLMSVRAPVGDLNIAKEDICIGRGVCGLQMKKGDNEFLYYLLKANILHLINKESGTVFGSINKNDIETFEVTIPGDSKDQMKILTILKNIDKKIEVNKELNKKVTSIYLQKIYLWEVEL